MPLHLLGKKSWNVYNADNIARVRRDEAEARSREAEAERKERDENGETRLAQLRGLDTAQAESAPSSSRAVLDDDRSYSRKRGRPLPGENDTDRDIRLAQTSMSADTSGAAASLTDHRGNFDLISPKAVDGSQPKHKPEKEVDVLGVRLADAAGRGPRAGQPWYNTTSATSHVQDTAGRDVWGNEDAGRNERDKKRINASDPLAAMKQGVKRLRQAEAQKQEWREQRERDLVEVEHLARRERKRQRRSGEGEDDINGFDLDAGYSRRLASDRDDESPRKDRHHHSHRHHRRHRHHSRSRSRSPRRRRE